MNTIIKTKTTYGVYNLVEWHARLRMGRATVKVAFVGGAITTQGVTPATFITEDPVVQFAIENSPEFKSGKIKIIRRAKLDGTVEIGSNPKRNNEAKPDTECTMQNDEAKPDTECTMQNEASEDKPEIEAEKPSSPLLEMEFDCNDDAKDYLEKTFGCTRSKIKTRTEIVAAGLANGVNILFT